MSKKGAEVTIPLKLQLDTDEAMKDLQEFSEKTKANVSAFSSAKRILDGFEKSMTKAFDGKGVDATSAKVLRLQDSMSKVAGKLLGMKETFKEVFERETIRNAWSSPEKQEELSASIDNVRVKMKELLAEREALQAPASGVNDYWLRMNEGYKTALANLQHYNSERHKLEQEGGKGSDEWKRLSEAMTTARRQMAGYKSQMKTAMSTEDIEAAKQKIKEIDAEYDLMGAKLKELTDIKNLFNKTELILGDEKFLEDFARLAVQIRAADLEIQNIEKDSNKLGGNKGATSYTRGFYLMRTIINDIQRGLNSLQEKLKKITSGMLNVAKSMLGLNKESKRTTTSLNNGFKHALTNILKYGFGIRSLFFLFRRLRKYAIEALGEMAKTFPEVNTQMSRAVTALNQMKGALGTAIQPLLTVVVPVLEKIANLISRIMSLIGGVFATLTGQGKIYQAVATQTDYAASLDKTGASAKKAKKELEGYLSPIDEINKYQSKKDDDDGGGAGAGVGYKMVETPISGFAKKIADILKKLWAPIKKAWDDMGKIVTASWKRAWNSVKKLLMDIGRDFLEMWNQEATVEMFRDIFRIIANIGDVVHFLAKNFDEAWNKNKVGLHILEKIRDIFAIIIKHIEKATDATVEWAKNLDFSPLLEAFDSFLESLKPVVDNIAGVFEDFYTQVMLPLAKWTIEKGLPEILGIFEDFNNKVDWEGLRAKLSELWQHLEPFAERVGEGLILFIDDVMNKIAEFINDGGLDELIDNLNEFMDSITAEDVEGTIWGIVNALIALKGAAIVGSILGKVALAIKEISMVVSNWGAISGILSTLGGIASFITGLTMAVSSFVDMWKNGWSTISTILEAIGIALVTIGVIILAPIEGIGIAIAAVVAAVVFAISQIVIVIHDNWDAIKQFFVDLWDSIVEIWNGVVDWFKTNIIDPLVSFWEGFSSRVRAIFQGLWIIIQAIWKVVSTWFNQYVIQPLVNFFAPIVAKISGFFQTMWNKVKAIWSVVANWFKSTVITPIQNAFNVCVNAISGFFSKLWDGITSGVKSAFKSVVGVIEKAINGVIDIINGFLLGFNAIVSAAAAIVGKNWDGVNLISPVHINVPGLAQGAVIPPNREFMAVLGDQKSGTNIETPLETMIEAFNTALRQNGGTGGVQQINFLLPDRRTLAQYTIAGGKIIQTSTGKNPFELA